VPFKPLKLPAEPVVKKEKLEEKIEKVEQPPLPQQERVAKLSPSKDPTGGWKRLILEGDPISVTDIEKSFTEDKVISGVATSQYDNTIKEASAGQSFEISLIDVWNNSGADRTVAFRFGTGTLRFQKKIADKTGYLINLVKTKWKGPVNTAFNIYCYETSPAVSYTVFGELV
jgi:hypothetical protein